MNLFRIIVLINILLFYCGRGFSQEEAGNRYVVRSTLWGLGVSNIFDTYLSPLEYKGPEMRFMHERMRMTGLMDGKVSTQSIIQFNISQTKNISKTARSYTGMINWSYAMHYQHRASDNFKILFGPMIDTNLGFIYNTRNSNNPAQAKAYLSLDASAMAIYKLKIKNYPIIARYQMNLPVMGMAFSPEYGQSYYEIFSLGHHGRNVLFTSFHNAPSLRQMLTLDFPLGKSLIRTGYLCDIQQFRLNNLKSHMYSHNFMIGFVRSFFLVSGKNRGKVNNSLNPFLF